MADNNLEFIISAKDQASSVFGSFAGSVGSAFAGIKNQVNSVFDSIAKSATLLKATQMAGDAFKAIGKSADSAKKSFEQLYKPFDDMRASVTGMVNLTIARFEIMKEKVSAAITEAFRPLTFVKDSFLNVARSVAQAMTGVFSGVASAIRSAMSAPMHILNGFADGVFAIQERVKGFFDQSIFKLASLGGAYAEQVSQFENLAQAYGAEGGVILKIIDDISGGSMIVLDRVKLGAKAISAGLNPQQLEDTLKYVKKFTESTGQSFGAMAETVFGAMAGGRFSVLRQMGIFVADGAKMDDVVKSMQEQIVRFGEASFNTSDAIEKINAKTSDFVTFIGEAINSSSSWQRVMTAIADSVDSFVKDFDFARVGAFFDALIRTGEIIFVSLKRNFQGIFDSVFETFANLGSKSGAKEFFDFISIGALRVAESLVKSLEYIGNLVVPTIITSLGAIVQTAGQVFEFFDVGINKIVKRALSAMAEIVLAIGEAMDELQNTRAASWLGISDVSIGSVWKIRKTLNDMAASISVSSSGIGESIQGIGEKITDYGTGLVFNFGDRFSKMIEKAKQDVSAFQLPDLPIFDPFDPEAAKKARLYQQSQEKFYDDRKKMIEDGMAVVKSAQEQEMSGWTSGQKIKMDDYKRELEAARLINDEKLSAEEKLFRRKQEDAAEAFKAAQLKPDTTVRPIQEIYDRMKFNIEELRAMDEKAFRRKQEDELEAFKKEEAIKKNNFKLLQDEEMKEKEAQNKLTEEAVKSSFEKAAAAAKTALEAIRPAMLEGKKLDEVAAARKTAEMSLDALEKLGQAAVDLSGASKGLSIDDLERKMIMDSLMNELKLAKTPVAPKPIAPPETVSKQKDSKNLQTLADDVKQKQDKASQVPASGKTSLALKILPSGNRALDSLAAWLLEFYEIQADAEGVKVLAG